MNCFGAGFSCSGPNPSVPVLLGGRGDAAVPSRRRAERAEETHFNFSSGIYSRMDNLQANVLFRKCILLAHLPATLVFFLCLGDGNEEGKLCLSGGSRGHRHEGWLEPGEGRLRGDLVNPHK